MTIFNPTQKVGKQSLKIFVWLVVLAMNLKERFSKSDRHILAADPLPLLAKLQDHRQPSGLQV